jgi:WD40 repeat protein
MKKIILISIIFLSIFNIGNAQKVTSTFETENSNIYDICFANNGESLAVTDFNSIKVFSFKNHELINIYAKGHNKQILTIDISKDNKFLISGGQDSLIVIWNFTKNKIIKTLKYHQGIVTSLKISPDSKYLISGGTDNTVFLYDLKNHKLIHEFNDHSNDVTSVSFSPNKIMFASASADKTINLYNLEKYELITTISDHKSWVRDVSFSPDFIKMISCGDDSKIIEWNIENLNKLKSTIYKGKDWIVCANYNNLGDAFAASSISGKIYVSTHYVDLTYKLKVPANKIIFVPNNPQLKLIIATLGKGVIMLDANSMKLKNK